LVALILVALSWLHVSGSSRVATAGETTAPSRMEQSADVGGALLPLVRCEHVAPAD
jgi:hypothetical protein